mgnify:CR=1 FL=1|tara:strand:+ start:913 stop:2370 length:1458 start_codon:yes stop_codon:yes gene_type:complete
MKIKKSIFNCGLALVLSAGVANAQGGETEGEKKPLPAWLDNVYFGGSVGLTTTITDLKQYDLYPVMKFRNEYGYGGDLYAGYSFSPVISVDGHFGGFSLNGTSRSKGEWFHASAFASSLNLKLNLTNMIFSGSSKKDRKWSVSSYAGLGLTSFKSAAYNLSDGEDTDQTAVRQEGYTDISLEESNRTKEISIPLGVQLTYKVTSNIDLFLDGRLTYLKSDKLDATVQGSGSSEYYTYHAIGVNYKFADKWVRPEDKLMEDMAKMDSILDGFKDTDSDGVMDSYDKDNKTPEGAIVDGGGNAMDTDGDGVADYVDQERLSICTEVDENGVALDTDGDNVPNCKDSEPNTPAGAQVDVTGKQINTLGAVAPTEGGSAGADVGLPSVYFTLNSTTISYTNYPSLTEVAKFLKNNADTKLAIVGHTDSTGPKAYNEKLGKKRSQAVIDHLVKIYGIDAARLSAASKGNSEILAKGQANVNRRVDFLLTK